MRERLRVGFHFLLKDFFEGFPVYFQFFCEVFDLFDVGAEEALQDFSLLLFGEFAFFGEQQSEPFAEVCELVGFNPDYPVFFLVFLHEFGEDAEFREGFQVFDDCFV